MKNSLHIKKPFDQKSILNKSFKNLWSLFRAGLFIGLGYIIVYPLIYMVSMSFRSVLDVYDVSVKWIPKNFTLDNIVKIVKAVDYPDALLLTIFISIATSLLLVLSCSLTAYGLSHFKFKGRELIFVLVLFTIIAPQQFFTLSSFLNFKYFNLFGLLEIPKLITGQNYSISLIDSPITFFLPAAFGIGIRSGLYIFIFRQFFKGMPKELEEAAYIDGCGIFKTFYKIILPNAVPAFVTSFLFSFVWHWNDYQLSSMFLMKRKTLSTILVNILNLVYEAQASTGMQVLPDTNQMMIDIQVGCLLVVFPVVVVYIILQRYFTESIERTGLVE